MKEVASHSDSEKTSWLSSVDATRMSYLRGAFAFSALIYFASCLVDAGRWFGADGLISGSRLGSFLRAAELQDQAKWLVSPLWWTDSLWIHQAFLVAGILIAIAVMAGRAPRGTLWVLWLVCVSVANRYLTLSGLAESWLSLSLMGLAVAGCSDPPDWRRSFGLTLLLCQFTVLGCITTASMWAGEVWRNGLGAIALAEPSSLKTFDWSDSLLTTTLVHDCMTTFLVVAIPLGLWLAWKPRRQAWGFGLLVTWACLVAVLGSHWLYALVFACNAGAFLCRKPVPND